MYRNWKSAAALGLAVLLGCMMPMGTMLAAETGTGPAADNGAAYDDESASDSGSVSGEEKETVSDGENVPGNETVLDEENAPEDETVLDEENAPEDETVSGGENASEDEAVSGGENAPEEEAVSDEGNASEEEAVSGGGNASEDETVSDEENAPEDESAGGMQDAGIMSAPAAGTDTETNGAGSASAPEIIIKRGGTNTTCPLGGKIDFVYVNYLGTLCELSVGQSDESVSLFYALDKVTDMEAEAKKEEGMKSLEWGSVTPPVYIEPNSGDGCYVVYVKAEAGGQTYFARSNGIVVDTQKPVIKGVEEGEGKTYPEGTLFQVEDANLDKVLVNEQVATPENGNYKVVADGTSCVIRAIDKARHETVYSINVSGTGTPEPSEPEKPEPGPSEPDDSNVISKSGEYTLKAGVKYHLAEGKWKVDGDKSVYRGGSDFYVKADGSYKFTK